MQTNSEIIQHLQQFLPFQKMQPDHLQFLVENCSLNYFAKGEYLMQIGDSSKTFYIVKQGLIQTQEEVKGSQFHKNAFQFEEGDCFPLGSLLSRNNNSISRYEALKDTFVYEIPADIFYQLKNLSPEFRDYCELRLANLVEESKRIMQSQYADNHNEQQLFSMPVAEVMRSSMHSCSPSTPIRAVLDVFDQANIGSMVVVNEQQQALGIFTLHDILRRVSIPQKSLDAPISEVMTPEPISLSPESLAFEAALLMAQHGLRHVLVCQASNGKALGVISENDLFRLQRVGLHQLSWNIQQASTLERLKECALNTRDLSRNMMAQGVSITQITHLVTILNDLVVRRLFALNKAKFADLQDIDFCWLAFGSEGRMEQMIYTDQDNGIIFQPQDPSHKQVVEAQRQHLLAFAQVMNNDLDFLGFPLCTGNIMARNPECCLTLNEWKRRFQQWIFSPTPEALLKSTIFFDFRALAGNLSLATDLSQWLLATVKQEKLFLRFLSQNALLNRPPLGLVGQFTLNENDAIDLKINGSALFIDAARIMSLDHSISATNTIQRLKSTLEHSNCGLSTQQINAFMEAFLYIQMLRFRQHFQQSQDNIPFSNQIKPREFNSLEARILRESFRIARDVQSYLSHRFLL